MTPGEFPTYSDELVNEFEKVLVDNDVLQDANKLQKLLTEFSHMVYSNKVPIEP